ncbi:hypothetical protein WAI453_013047 [Rhynchosporium graminicola]
MDYTEEENSYRPSQLKPPGSRIPSPPKMGLVEISESQGNARSKIMSRMPPPTSLKHKLGGACQCQRIRTKAENIGGKSWRGQAISSSNAELTTSCEGDNSGWCREVHA